MKKKLVTSVLALSMVVSALAPAASFASAAKPVPAPVVPVVAVKTTPPVTGQGQVQPDNLISNIIRKAIIASLRYGGPYLGKMLQRLSPKAAEWVTKNTGRIADFLEAISDWQEATIASGLVAIGCPPDIAIHIAYVIVLIAGF
ncbi:hypothetical protein [Paenibacillus elgii]|uniref:hypothetical protein n=1 Tax=Paenibacillus elgii TaxID=189691 RepID=UPI000248CB85|nr:hypothetical protein [Paenibacillus elgii]